jgi:hypothetical protein
MLVCEKGHTALNARRPKAATLFELQTGLRRVEFLQYAGGSNYAFVRKLRERSLRAVER